MTDLTISRTRWVVVAALLAAAAAIVTVVLDAGHAARPAAAATPTANDVVTVSGVGVVQGVPDTLDATFDVHVTRSSVQSTLDAEATSVHRVVNALASAGISGRAVQTTSLQLSQHYDNHGQPSGYEANETVTAKISPLHNAGRVISAGATASGDDVSVDGLTFDIADDHALLTQARGKAFGDARDRAQQYAGLANRSLGDVVSISEKVTTQEPVRGAYLDVLRAGASGAKAVPIRPGEQPVTVNVTVTWRLH